MLRVFRALPRWILFWLFAVGIFLGSRDGLAFDPLAREVVVEGEVVRLGQLFEDVPAHMASRAVARAPSPGNQVTVSPRWLAKIARSNGLEGPAAHPAEPLTVRRLGARIEAAAIADLVAGALAQEMGLDDLEIRLDGGAGVLVVAGSDAPSLHLENVRYSAGDGRFSATLSVEADGRTLQQRPLSGRAVAMVKVPVLTRAVTRGGAIQASDITSIAMMSDAIAANVVTNPGDLVGMTADRSLRAGRPVLRHDVSHPLLVERGKPVTMIVQRGSLVISARGKALTDGAYGEVVRVLNTDSGRTIEAVATAPGTVRSIGSGSPAQTAALR